MLRNLLKHQGGNYQRLRIATILLLAPVAVYTFAYSGWVTDRFGSLAEQRWDFLCLLIAFTGLGIRLHLAGHEQAAEAGELLPRGSLQTTGFYSVVRHPAYLANFLIVLAGSLLFKNLIFSALVVILSRFYYRRLIIARENAMLEKYGQEFLAWASVTPRILPKFSQWKNPPVKFSLTAAAGREALTFALIGLVFFTLETLEGTMIDGLPFWEWVHDEPHWLALFAISAIILWTQLSRVGAILALVISSIFIGSAHFADMIPVMNTSEARALSALKAGGHVLLMRHSFTTGKDRENPDVNDCSTQRNLSERGRDHARMLGRILSEAHVPIVRTITSQFCRTQETAQLMGHDADETMPNLNEQRTHVTLLERLFGNYEKDERIFRPVRGIISGWKEKDNLLLVSHAPIITGLTYSSLRMGEGLVLKPAPHLPLGFRVIGKFPQSQAASQ